MIGSIVSLTSHSIKLAGEHFESSVCSLIGYCKVNRVFHLEPLAPLSEVNLGDLFVSQLCSFRVNQGLLQHLVLVQSVFTESTPSVQTP